MIDPLDLAFDISSVVVSTAVPGIAWALLFVLAWRRPRFAESVGFGPRTFWLLLPGALLASFALLPVAPISNDVVAVSFAGAVFPLGIAVVALGRVASPLRRWAAQLFAPLSVETATLLGVVVLADRGALHGLARATGTSSWGVELGLVVGLAAAASALVAVWPGRGSDEGGAAVAGTFALTSGVLVLTFVGARAIPGVGIAESYPYYLLPPVLAGVVAVLLAPWLFEGAKAFALPVGFFAGGWGVVLGADVLWQPPLYGTGPAGVYAVGGAGVLDLVYLSGLLGLLGAWGTHRLLRRELTPVGAPLPPSPASPSRKLREAYVLVAEGAPGPSVTASAEAARASALQAQRLFGRPSSDPSRPWTGLPVPGWVISDQANLESVAQAGTTEPREALRSFATARALVRFGESLGRPRFASIVQRLAAFVVDVAILGAAGAAVFAAIVLSTRGGLVGALDSVAFNAAIYGLVGASLLYFAVAELVFAATVGKALVGIEVRDRSMGPIGGVASFVRNTPLLPVMTLYSVGLALGIAIALRGTSASGSLAGLGLPAGTIALLSIGAVVLAGVGLAGAVGVATMALTSERQRVGDLWAGTWVVRRLRRALPSSPPAAVRFG